MSIEERCETFLRAYHRHYPERATRAGAHVYGGRLSNYSQEETDHWFSQLNGWERESAPDPSQNPGEGNDLDWAALRFHLRWELFLHERLDYPLRDPGLIPRTLGEGLFLPLHRRYAPLPKRLDDLRGRLLGVPEVLRSVPSGRISTLDENRPPARLLVEMALDEVEGLLDFISGPVASAFSGAGVAAGGPETLLPADAQLLAEACGALTLEKGRLLDLQRVASTFLELRWGSDRLQEAVYLLSGLGSDAADRGLRLGELLYRAEDELRTANARIREAAREVDSRRTSRAVSAESVSKWPPPDRLLESVGERLQEETAFLKSCGQFLVPPAAVAEPMPAYVRRTVGLRTIPVGALEPEPVSDTVCVVPPPNGLPRVHRERYLTPFSAYRWLSPLSVEAGGRALGCVEDAKLRFCVDGPALGPGWAQVFPEAVLDAGWGAGDARYRLNCALRRRLELLRFNVAIRIHTGRCDLEQAVWFFEEKADLDPETALEEARSVARAPLSGISGPLGRWQIAALRDRLRLAWGTTYSERRFHETLLGCGHVPVPLLGPILESVGEATQD